uniref:Putative flavanone 7-O-glucoside 2''-O-beta-L-rhamnosyltransferase-like n=1 Tax=Solanum chacoense TaxID=4108 RepID=A0A0V0I3Z4_SOLCH
MDTFKQAFDSSTPQFTKILKTLKPDLLIYDFLQPWAPLAASQLNIPAVEFISSSSTMTAYMWHDLLKKPKGIEFPFSSTIYYRDYEMASIERSKAVISVEKIEADKNRVGQSFVLSNHIVLIKSFNEIEGKYSNYITSLTGKKIVPVGPLVQEPTPDDTNSNLIKWLNTKDKRSTVFVSFGSEYFLSNEDLLEIAYGLENSKVNFIWPLRFAKEEVEIEEALPKGFVNRVGDRGRVFKGWAPQAKILEHLSIGGFVSHCGWSSVMESMKYGVPIIAMPMHLDQPMNSRLIVEEVGMAVEVVRDGEGKLHWKEVVDVINHVVVEEGGELVREKANHMKEIIRSKGDEEIDQVAKELEMLLNS